MIRTLIFTICLALVFNSNELIAAEELDNKTISKIYTYSTLNGVIFKFEPTGPTSCDRENYAYIDTTTQAGKQAYTTLLTARAMDKPIDFRGYTEDCSDVWQSGGSMLIIYRIDF